MRPPLCTPPAASPSEARKCADFRASALRKPISFRVVSVQKSEHFWTLAGEAAGGVHRGGRIFVAPPLCRFLLVLFLAKQEKYMTALTYYEKIYILAAKERG